MTIPFKSIYLTYIFFSLISSFAISSTAINYLLFAFILCIWIIFLIVGIKSRVSFIWIDFIPMIFILTWAYGVFLGFLFGNNITFIISNFAGMTIFSIYYIILFSQDTRLVRASVFTRSLRASKFPLAPLPSLAM